MTDESYESTGEQFDDEQQFHSAAPDRPEQLDQSKDADGLSNRGVDDVLDEGYTSPTRWSAAQGFGNTPAEMRQGETLEQRLVQEEPEDDSYLDDLDGTAEEAGNERSGRLVAPDEGIGVDVDAELIAQDVGIDAGVAGAEEAAVHVIDEQDLGRSVFQDEGGTPDPADPGDPAGLSRLDELDLPEDPSQR